MPPAQSGTALVPSAPRSSLRKQDKLLRRNHPISVLCETPSPHPTSLPATDAPRDDNSDAHELPCTPKAMGPSPKSTWEQRGDTRHEVNTY